MSVIKTLYFFIKRTYKGTAMDEAHNMQRGDVLARFIDSQEIHANPFGENRVAERAYRRAERIAAGLHLITAHVPQEEPLRQKVRDEAVVLLSRTIALRSELRSLESSNIDAFHASIRYLISLARLLTAGGFVSFQNAEAIVGALDDLSGFVDASQRSNLAESISLTRDDLLGPTGPLVPIVKRPFVKDTGNPVVIQKDSESVKDKNVSVTISRTSNSAASWQNRSRDILDVLRSGHDFSIRDICVRLPDYSEKMIQRELAALVADGRVKKDGLKRWSRYSVATR